jgi:hypothetical protein
MFILMVVTIVIHLVSTPIFIIYLYKTNIQLFKSFGGSYFFFNPYYQFKFLIWIVSRKYAGSIHKKFYYQDLYLINLSLMTISFIDLIYNMV